MLIEENIKNMERCPRFKSCNIPKCPLDFWMSERTELTEDKKCVLFKMIYGKKTAKMRKGVLSPAMRGIFKFIREENLKTPYNAN